MKYKVRKALELYSGAGADAAINYFVANGVKDEEAAKRTLPDYTSSLEKFEEGLLKVIVDEKELFDEFSKTVPVMADNFFLMKDWEREMALDCAKLADEGDYDGAMNTFFETLRKHNEKTDEDEWRRSFSHNMSSPVLFKLCLMKHFEFLSFNKKMKMFMG